MPLGPLNIPPGFQDYINKILAKKLDIFVIFYLDNIPIVIENSYLSHVDAVW